MPQSLIALARSGGRLPALDVASVHYPAEGAAALASIEASHFWFTSRRAAVWRLLRRALGPSDPAGRIVGLDIGCGSGYTAAWLTDRGAPTLGVDAMPAPSWPALADRTLGLLPGDITAIDPAQEFDFVLLLDVLEHIDDDAAFLAHALGFLKPMGVAIVTMPAFAWLWSPIDAYSGHRRRYTRAMVRSLVDRIGPGARLELASYFYATTFLPFAVSRLRRREVRRAIHDESSPPAWINATLAALLRAEARIVSFGVVPFGSSVVGVVRKYS
ncbi:MAG TPA: class I SAM-dependent methyltransferase [Gemmatimonadaceae bacterium]|nr:class I SAM-dependent methyltransferase [Gemmatimonadaceae bacterium]